MQATAGTVTRVDYANGVYVTYEKMTPDSDGYDVGQKWFYAVWSSEVDDHSTGFEVEDSGYAETKAEAVAFARETREAIARRRSAKPAPVAEPRYYVYDRKVSPLTTFSAINPRYWVVDRTTGQRVDECQTKRAATLAARFENDNAANEVEPVVEPAEQPMTQTEARRLARSLSASTGLVHVAVTVPRGCWGGTEQGWTVDGPAASEVVKVELDDDLVGKRLRDFDGSILVVGEPAELDGYRVLYNVDGDELDQSYNEAYLETLTEVTR